MKAKNLLCFLEGCKRLPEHTSLQRRHIAAAKMTCHMYKADMSHVHGTCQAAQTSYSNVVSGWMAVSEPCKESQVRGPITETRHILSHFLKLMRILNFMSFAIRCGVLHSLLENANVNGKLHTCDILLADANVH